jgi:hypothetical protein
MECLNNRSSSYAKFFSRSADAVIRVFDDAGNVIEMLENKGNFKELLVD